MIVGNILIFGHKMRLISIKGLNFQSYESISLDFNEGAICIVGPNMSGKTTTARLLSWLLTGKFPFPGMTAFTKDLVAPFGDTKQETIGELIFEVSSKDSASTDVFKLIRKSSSEGTYLKLSTENNEYEWTADGAQEMVLNLAKIPPASSTKERIELFIRSFWYGVGQPTSFFSAKGTERRKILESMDPSTKLGIMYNEAASKEKELSKQIDILKNEISTNFGESKARVSDLSKAISFFNINVDSINYNETNYSEKFDYLKSIASNTNKSLGNIKIKNDKELIEIVDSLSSEELRLNSYIPIIKQIEKHNQELSELKQIIEDQNVNENIEVLKETTTALHTLEKNIEDYKILLKNQKQEVNEIFFIERLLEELKIRKAISEKEVIAIEEGIKETVNNSSNISKIISGFIYEESFIDDVYLVFQKNINDIHDEINKQEGMYKKDDALAYFNLLSDSVKAYLYNLSKTGQTPDLFIHSTKNQISEVKSIKNEIDTLSNLNRKNEITLNNFYNSIGDKEKLEKTASKMESEIEFLLNDISTKERRYQLMEFLQTVLTSIFSDQKTDKIRMEQDILKDEELEDINSRIYSIISDFIRTIKDIKHQETISKYIASESEFTNQHIKDLYYSILRNETNTSNIDANKTSEIAKEIIALNEYLENLKTDSESILEELNNEEQELIKKTQYNISEKNSLERKFKNFNNSLNSLSSKAEDYPECDHCGGQLNEESLKDHIETVNNDIVSKKSLETSLSKDLDEVKKLKEGVSSELKKLSNIFVAMQNILTNLIDTFAEFNYQDLDSSFTIYTKDFSNTIDIKKAFKEESDSVNHKINIKTEEFETILNTINTKENEVKDNKLKIINEILSEESSIAISSFDSKELYSFAQNILTKHKDNLSKRLREYDSKNSLVRRDIYDLLSVYNKSLSLLSFTSGEDFEVIVKKEVNSKKQEISNINSEISANITKKDKIKNTLKSEIEGIIKNIDIEAYTVLLENNTIIKLVEDLKSVIKSNEGNESKTIMNNLDISIKVLEDVYVFINNKITSIELDVVELNKIILECKNIESIINKLNIENLDIKSLRIDDIEIVITNIKKEKLDALKNIEVLNNKTKALKINEELKDNIDNIAMLLEKLKEYQLNMESYQTLKGILSPNGDARTISMADTASSLVRMTNEILSDMELSNSIYVDIVLEKGEDEQPALEINFVPGNGEMIGQKVKALPSESQRKIIGFIMDLSLKRLMNPNGFIIIDEPETGLDEINRNKIMKFLKSASSQVILITNTASSMFEYVVKTSDIRTSVSKEAVSSYFDGIIGLRKEKNKKGDKKSKNEEFQIEKDDGYI